MLEYQANLVKMVILASQEMSDHQVYFISFNFDTQTDIISKYYKIHPISIHNCIGMFGIRGPDGEEGDRGEVGFIGRPGLTGRRGSYFSH